MSKATKVLVVEDEPIVRLDITDSLEDDGLNVVEAANAAEADMLCWLSGDNKLNCRSASTGAPAAMS